MTLLTDSILVELLDAAPDAMLSFDQDGLIVMANLQAELLFGYSRELLIGRPVTTLMAINLKKIEKESSAILITGYFFDGKEFLAEVSISAIANASNPIIIATVRDVSARGELEAERIRVKSEAERVRLEVAAELVTAEGEKSVAEQVRLVAEAALVTAKSEKTVAEQVRLEAEAALVTAKSEKTVAERVRLEAEAALVTAEDEKDIAEIGRAHV